MIDHYYEGADDQAGQGPVCVRLLQRRRGPIAQLRKEAAKRGLDPNVWFHNVEYVAAEKIGQETVTYVSNIYKYYIAYRLILENQAAKKEAIEKIRGQGWRQIESYPGPLTYENGQVFTDRPPVGLPV